MSRIVILIRHCKSDWDGSTDDHDRPLSARGNRAAPRIGAFLSQHGLVPDVALCSDAMRTRQTWAAVAAHLPGAPPPNLSAALYLAEPEVMLKALQATTAPTVAMIAHNPGTAALAWALTQTPPADSRFATYPTGATTVLQFDGAIAPGAGHLLHFIVPRDLDDPA
ncbi:histidine phosphatase family protein [Rhodobacteraceae bacterium N5(2021)]|uniref:Histidine phosphatase family protein n=1 Tax=Gymnodinialimonas phycosphaerae TaxID=2841589 RepID=A0A975TV94_9RHOB|nr:histidine phosphatase family protein [Gymnodinialimonas phycosphaerae]MBY4894710.1 histidine phosphatase family protein [Gymnodinialimonas phycosphaerae]